MTTDEIKDHFQLTIITPCYNEEDSVAECASKVQHVMETQLPEVSYEHIFIDNSSKDNTVSKLREIARNMPKVRVLVNSHNIGPFRSVYSVMSHASGDAVIPVLPTDLQDPAEKIPDLYHEWLKGHLVVY